MSFVLSEKVRSLSPYEPISGEFDIRLDANESYFPLSREIMEEFCLKLKELELNRYPDGSERELISAFAKRYDLDENCICAGNGSDELISVIIGALLPKDSKILTLEPDFSMYRQYAYAFEKAGLREEKDDSFSFNPKEIAKRINAEGIDCLIFSNPCNPTGAEIKKSDILYLAQSTDALIIADEAYMEFSDGKCSVLKEAEEQKGLIVLKTLSKAVGLAGARLGFAVCEKETAKALNALRSPYNLNSMSQLLGKIVLSRGEELDLSIKNIKIQTNRLYSFLAESRLSYIKNVFPTRANFVLIEPKDAKELWERLAKRKIAVRQLGKYIRISAPAPEEEARLFEALRELDKA